MSIFGQQGDVERFSGRYLVMVVVGILSASAIILRLYQLQVLEGEQHVALSQANFVDLRRQVALRGMIFDRNGTLLADNRPSFNVYFTPAYCRHQAFEQTLARLTEYLGLSILEIDRVREAYRSAHKLQRWVPVLVRRNIAWEELALLEQHLDFVDGVEVRPETRRAYPGGKLAAHVIGYVGEISSGELKKLKDRDYRQGDLIGKYGVERAFEAVLKGTNGLTRVVVDSRKQPVPQALARKLLEGAPEVKAAVAGNNLVLSLDARLQQRAEERFPGQEGAVVALDPNNGFLLAMVLYHWKKVDPARIAARIRPVYDTISNKYYLDDFNDVVFVKGTIRVSFLLRNTLEAFIDFLVNLTGLTGRFIAFLHGLFDRYVVDGLVNFWWWLTHALSSVFRILQTGSAKDYLAFALVGALILALIMLFVA